MTTNKPCKIGAGVTVFVGMDCEFVDSQEPHPRLMCAVLQAGDDAPMEHYWLWGGADTAALVARLEGLRETGTLVAYAAGAEARCLMALGLDPRAFRWADLYAEHRLLLNHVRRWTYGPRWKESKKSGWKARSAGKDAAKGNLVNAELALLGEKRDPGAKKAMRDLILEARDTYTPEEQARIQDYCQEDVTPLPRLRVALAREILAAWRSAGLTKAQYLEHRDTRARWTVDLAVVEGCGIPVDTQAMQTLSNNTDAVKDEAIRGLVHNVYPFFEEVADRNNAPRIQVPTKAGHLRTRIDWDNAPMCWIQRYELFETWVKEQGLAPTWPRTDTGAFSTEDKVLKDNEHHPEIAAYRDVRKTLQQMKWYRPEALPDVLEAIGSDGRLRPYFGPYGTQTGRNAPPAKQFVPAQSSWLRSLIRPPEGYTHVTVDWASQENYLGAAISGDAAMLRAYEEGDVYLAYGKAAGLVPPDGTKAEFAGLRERVLKPVVLGLGYGMGKKKLADILTRTTGELVTPEAAGKYGRAHRKAYPRYWAMRDRAVRLAEGGIGLLVADGWGMGPANPSSMSVANFPVQAAGAVCLRAAVHRALNEGLRVIYPLHDSISVLARDEDAQAAGEQLARLMVEETMRLYPNTQGVTIRADVELYPRKRYYLGGRGASMFEKMARHLGFEFVKNGKYYEETL